LVLEQLGGPIYLWLHHDHHEASIGGIKEKGKASPPAIGKGEQIQVRMQSPLLAALDAWIKDQPAPKPTRTEAIRSL
jgi:hypothetical protein